MPTTQTERNGLSKLWTKYKQKGPWLVSYVLAQSRDKSGHELREQFSLNGWWQQDANEDKRYGETVLSPAQSLQLTQVPQPPWTGRWPPFSGKAASWTTPCTLTGYPLADPMEHWEACSGPWQQESSGKLRLVSLLLFSWGKKYNINSHNFNHFSVQHSTSCDSHHHHPSPELFHLAKLKLHTAQH